MQADTIPASWAVRGRRGDLGSLATRWCSSWQTWSGRLPIWCALPSSNHASTSPPFGTARQRNRCSCFAANECRRIVERNRSSSTESGADRRQAATSRIIRRQWTPYALWLTPVDTLLTLLSAHLGDTRSPRNQSVASLAKGPSDSLAGTVGGPRSATGNPCSSDQRDSPPRPRLLQRAATRLAS
jgi:hypothetical protein